MGKLCAVKLRTGPFHASIGRTLTEIHMIFPWKTFQIFIGEHQGRIDQPVNHQTVIAFLEIYRPRVVTLKGTALRCDCAVECMNRREIDRTDRIGGQPFHVTTNDIRLIFNRQSIGCDIHAIPEAFCPILWINDQRVSGLRLRGGGGHNPCPNRSSTP